MQQIQNYLNSSANIRCDIVFGMLDNQVKIEFSNEI